MSGKPKLSEVDVARPIVAWLEERGWDVYQEVQDRDLVAVQGPLVWTVETKTSLSTALCAQADYRRGTSHLVSVGIPTTESRNDPGRSWAIGQLVEIGIGVFVVLRDGSVREKHAPALRRRAYVKDLRAALCPEHKTHAPAGSTSSEPRWTSWRGTCEQVARIVRDQPGISLGEILSEGGIFHYASASSARSSLSHWLRLGKVPGVEVRQDGRHLRLYPRPRVVSVPLGGE